MKLRHNIILIMRLKNTSEYIYNLIRTQQNSSKNIYKNNLIIDMSQIKIKKYVSAFTPNIYQNIQIIREVIISKHVTCRNNIYA